MKATDDRNTWERFNCPSPDEIRERCQQIQTGWDAHDEMLRRGVLHDAIRVDTDGTHCVPVVIPGVKHAARHEPPAAMD